MSHKTVMQNLLLSLVSICFVLTCLELSARHLLPKQRSLGYITHPILHHVHGPNSEYLEKSATNEFSPIMVKFNSLGLREEREIFEKKGSNEFRILMLGDSFVEARQVLYEETVSQHLEKQLNHWAQRNANGKTFTVINAGVSKYSPSVEYLYLLNSGLALNPDIVIIYFTFNDVTDDFDYGPLMEFDAQGLPVRIHPPAKPTPSFTRKMRDFLRGLRVVDLARTGLNRLSMKLFGSDHEVSRVDRLYEQYAFAGTKSLTENALSIFKDSYEQIEVEAWDDTKRYLTAIANVLEERDIVFVLSVIPAPPQVSAVQWRIGKIKWGMKPDETIESTKMQDILKEYSIAQNVYYLDLLPAFKTNSKLKLFYDYDGHWTQEGNHIASRETFAFLKSMDLLPETL